MVKSNLRVNFSTFCFFIINIRLLPVMIVIETANFSYKYSLKSWNGMILDFPGGLSTVTNSFKRETTE